jgi:hypothetical protein
LAQGPGRMVDAVQFWAREPPYTAEPVLKHVAWNCQPISPVVLDPLPLEECISKAGRYWYSIDRSISALWAERWPNGSHASSIPQSAWIWGC